MQQMLRAPEQERCMNRIKSLTILTVAAILQTAPSLSAQQQVFEAQVPFQFSAGDKTLPAGDYRITRRNDFLGIENRKDYSTALILASSADPSSDGGVHLVFDQVNNVFFLRQVVAPAGSIQLAVTRTEKRAQKDQRHLSATGLPVTTTPSATTGGR
jgi:hypothetical protein